MPISCFGEAGFVFRQDRFRVSTKIKFVFRQNRLRVSAKPFSRFCMFRRDRFLVLATPKSCSFAFWKPVSCFGETVFVFRRDRFRVSATLVSCFGKTGFAFWSTFFSFRRRPVFHVSIASNSCLVDTKFVFRRGNRFRVSSRRIVFRRYRFRVSVRPISCFGETGFVFRRDRFRVLAKPATLVSCFGETGFMFWRNRFVFRRD